MFDSQTCQILSQLNTFQLVYKTRKFGVTFSNEPGDTRLTRMEALINNKHLPAGVAQLVEHGTENPGVPSSILGPGTFYFVV